MRLHTALTTVLLTCAAPALAQDALTPPPLPPVDAPPAQSAALVDTELAPPPPTAAPTVTSATPAPVKTVPLPTPAVEVQLGPRYQNRSFDWAANGTSPYPGYVQAGDFAMAMGARWFPGAHFTTGLPANLGLEADGLFVLGSTSAGNNNTWANHSQRLRAGAVARFPVGKHLLDVSAGWLAQSFAIEAKSTTGLARPRLPNVELSALRGGVGLHLAGLGSAVVSLKLDGVVGLSFGELAQTGWFTGTSGAGVAGQVAITVPLTDGLQFRADVDFARYFFNLNAPASSLVQGAGDQYFTAGASLAWAM